MLDIINSPNFGPYSSPEYTVQNDSLQNEPSLTQLAKSLMISKPRTPLQELFPEETILERIVKIEQVYQGVDTIFPIVEFGKPDQVLNDEGNTRTRRYYQPLYVRRSAFMSHGDINIRIKPGTSNERWSPAEQIQEKMRRMIEQHNLTWDVWRAMVLLGGIFYTDPRSGAGARVSSHIPAHNMWSYDVNSGYRGRKENSLFRAIVDANVSDPGAAAGIPWTHPDAAIIECVMRFKRWFEDTNKSPLTAMYVSPQLHDVLHMSNEIRLAFGGIIPKLGASAGDLTIGDGGYIIPSGGAMPSTMPNSITIGAGGMITAIAGVEVRVVNTQFKDPTDGVVKRIWPMNKVVFVSEVDSTGAREAVGRTQFCVSEESGGAPGLWTRQQTQTQIPAAPGMYIQMGNAGMPYLKYPYRVAHMNVCSVDDIRTRMGVLGDLGFGSF